MVNGVPIYNTKDAYSFQNQGVWNQNAVVEEADGMDLALGHPSPVQGQNIGNFVAGRYHHHQRPVALLNELGDNSDFHSPLIGFAFDGFPIYGPYGYHNPDGSGAIVRIESSYQLRSGLRPPPQLGGPGGLYDGRYIEDYEYVAGLGHLDEHNGHFGVTPEYPDGIYHYVTAIDDVGESAYPYTLGPTYYGIVRGDNFNQSVVVPVGVVTYEGVIPGDFDGDGDIDGDDFLLWKNGFEISVDAALLDGDADVDGDVDGDDFLIWQNSFPYPAALSSVPEPASLVLFTLGGLMMLRRRAI